MYMHAYIIKGVCIYMCIIVFLNHPITYKENKHYDWKPFDPECHMERSGFYKTDILRPRIDINLFLVWKNILLWKVIDWELWQIIHIAAHFICEGDTKMKVDIVGKGFMARIVRDILNSLNQQYTISDVGDNAGRCVCVRVGIVYIIVCTITFINSVYMYILICHNTND